jgi:hypothetical protein
MKTALFVLLALVAIGCVQRSSLLQTRTILDVAAALLLELDAGLARGFDRAEEKCRLDPTGAASLQGFTSCLEPWYKAEGAKELARHLILAADRGLDGVEGTADGNPGRTIGCMAAAVGEALSAAAAVGVEPGSGPGLAWAQYSGTISNLCLMSEPGAMVSGGSSEEH